MILGRNLLAGLANSIWTAVMGLVVVPFYLKYLGAEAYGLIGFFMTTQALLNLLDMGMTPTINREVARCAAAGNRSEAGKLLHTLAVVNWGVAALMALLIASLAPLIAGHWLNSRQLSPDSILHAVMMMGFVVACRLPVGLYQGALIGAQRVDVSSAINIGMVTAGSGGAIAVLALVSPTVEAFFAWQLLVGVAYAAAMRAAAWKVVGGRVGRRFDAGVLRTAWRFAAGMSGIAVTSLVFTQLDKVILSKILSLDDFGYYMLATQVVNGLYLLINPVFNVVYPRMSAFVVANDEAKLAGLYRLGTRAVASVLFPGAMVLAIFAGDIVRLWTGNPHVAAAAAPIIALLAAGSALHGTMYFTYALQLAYGRASIGLKINIMLMVVQLPLMVVLALHYGALGGALSWLAFHVMYLLLGTWVTHRSLLPGLAARRLLQDVGVPLVLTLLSGLAVHQVSQSQAYGLAARLAAGALLALLASVIAVLSSPGLVAVLLGYLRRVRAPHA